MSDRGFLVQEALKRGDRRALSELAPCACNEDDYDINANECPAKVWGGCRAMEYEDWDSRGSNWEYDLEEYARVDPEDDLPDVDALTAHVAEISRIAPAGWMAIWKAPDRLVIANDASERVLVARIEDGDLLATVESHDHMTTYDGLEPTKLPPRAYFTPTWILRTLRPLFLKYHP